MNSGISRRALLASLPAVLAAPHLQAAAPGAAICMMMTYLNDRKGSVKFDARRYREEQIGLVRSALGDAVERIELRTPPPPPRGSKAPPSPVVADVSMWIRDLQAYAAAMQKEAGPINAGMARVTAALPVLQFDQVIGEWGAPRGAVEPETDSQALYYPWSEDAQWDADYFTATYLPKLVEAWGGEGVLRRVEVRRGVGGQGGAKPGFINSVHLYASNNPKFGMAGFRAAQELMADARKVTSIMPFVAPLRVVATA